MHDFSSILGNQSKRSITQKSSAQQNRNHSLICKAKSFKEQKPLEITKSMVEKVRSRNYETLKKKLLSSEQK